MGSRRGRAWATAAGGGGRRGGGYGAAVALAVALDVTPLHGPRTGIGQFVASTRAALEALPAPPTLVPYVLSLRAGREAGVRRLPYPAGAAIRLWGRTPVPGGRRSLRPASVVHATNYVAPPTGLPTVLTVHDCSFVTAPEASRRVVRAYEPVVRRAIGAGAWVHAPSEYVAAQVRALFGTDQVRAIHHGPPPVEHLPPGAPPLPGLDGRPYIVAVGTREPRKNLPRLVLAYGAVHARHPEVALVLLGAPGDDQPAVDAAIDALPRAAGESVLMTDWVPGPHRTLAIAHASALAYPSFDEGFGFPLLEAMQLGVAVVASDAGSVPEVAGGAAVLVPPTDTEALAAALCDVLDDDARRARLVAAGRDRVAAFDWSRQAHALVQLYRDAGAS